MSLIVVVTGATGDAGRAVCAALVRSGETVVAVGSDEGRLASVDASARFVADLADVSSTESLAARVRAEVGRVDGLVHLVGGWRGGQTDADFLWLERRILTTLRYATLAFRDDLSASPAGRLAIVGSSSAAKPTWSNAAYATVKSAADAWIRAVASGWRKGGTAAAVTLVVTTIGDGGTPPSAVAEAVTGLWSRPAGELNGTRLDLTASATERHNE
ncbi:MAG: oxidoreductase [Frondihabitans sp.]|nr:oxidoreductase [Frondihabitans sp.]